MADDLCPCGSDRPLSECCLPIIRGERDADTTEALMRSRYTAYAVGEIDHILASNHSDTRDGIERDEIERWSRDSDWLGLEVRDSQGGPGDDEGTVTFVARYRTDGTVHTHRERAGFVREDGQWKFHSVLGDGTEVELVPVAAASHVGRNDPCPCGSGKKYKKCCG